MVRGCSIIQPIIPAIFLVLIASCSPKGPTLYPVTGQVLYEGQPADGASVVFHPVTPLADGRLPSATADKSGAFTIRTYPYGEGAPEGEYTVITTWLKSGPGDQVRNQLPARYADAAKTPVKVSVKPGPNVLEPFRLTKAP